MTAHITAPALTVRIRADIDASTARDLAASLQLDGWEATGMTVPRTGSPEVTFPLIGALPTLHRLTRSLPRLLETWRVHHGLDAYEVVVSKAGDEATRTVLVKALVPNANGKLRSGMFANLNLVMQVRTEALVIPETALIIQGQTTTVFIVDEHNTVQPRPITPGRCRQRR